MDIQENMASVIRMIKENKNLSLTDFSEELEISRTMLQEYLHGKGNPSLRTIEHIAQRLGIKPAVLMTGLMELDRMDIALMLLDTIRNVAELEPKERIRFAELFLEMVQLWEVKS